MSVAVCALFVLALVAAMLSNRDLLSPGKFYLASLFLFSIGALANPGKYEVWLLVLLVVLVGIVLVVFESGVPLTNLGAIGAPELGVTHEPNVALILWAVTAPAIAAQLYMIVHFGGVLGYVNMISNRVVELRGLGWAKTLISTVTAINLLYFGAGLMRRRTRLWWAGYAGHLLVILAIGALSGSRGSLLSVFALQLFVYHYLRRPVRPMHAVGVAAALLVMALVLGVARNNLKADEGSIHTGLDSSERTTDVSGFSYGVAPLQLLLDHPDAPLAHGSTFVSVLTNVIPRAIWEDKPDTGGVYFTKVYTGDAWDGASNLTPTFLGEFVMNFGWIGGTSAYFFTSLIMMYLLARYYDAMLRSLAAPRGIAMATGVVVYVFVMWSAVALLTGELTNVVQNLMMTQLIPLWCLRRVLTVA